MLKNLILTEEPARRGFLRNLILAPAAALATHRLIVPAQALVTPGDAVERLREHVAGVEAAMRDLFPGANVRQWSNCLSDPIRYGEMLKSGEISTACIGFDAHFPGGRK